VAAFTPQDRYALLQATGETPEQIAAHPLPFYTPIANFGSDYLLEPVAYGLKFVGLFSGGTLLNTEFSTKLQAAGVNATAYAAKLPGSQASMIILNKDAEADLEAELDFGRGVSGAVETEILHAHHRDLAAGQLRGIGRCIDSRSLQLRREL
jgi:hypothetical protein